ncbi:MAG: MHS family MFS transporter [Phenylobacterium sp.]|uniref:MFS transporter n=1 Tax=Phenylobacterium sp. TaxID=1871053 RepID=UPI001A5E54CF|nr:MFS transporter [Phenylobacterium sp.]MBL8772530.1 MHS family MFS transporter [Phenylobacterium sp.]
MSAAEDTLASPSTLRRVVVASMIGTTIEWYDFFLYGTAAALVFNKLFFPASEPLVGTMLAFATYALGFVARPLGGVVFGHFGDRIGRKRLLMLSLMLMGGATVLIGCLPTFDQVGLLAPALLVLLRLVQGFAVGGEWGGAVLIVAEHGDARRRGFWASWPQAGVAAGSLMASGVLALMAGLQSEADFLAWGWRVPFLISAVLIGVGWWVRATVEESPTFQAVAREADAVEKAPALEAIRTRPRELLIGAGLKFAENISYYVVTVFSITYVTTKMGLPRATVLNAILVASAVHCVLIPLFGALSDRIGRRPVYAFGAFGMVIWAFVFFRLLDTADPMLITLACVGALVFHGAMYGPQAAFLAEMFPTRIRYSGASLSYQVTSIFAGSLAPLIAAALLRATGSGTPVAIYVAAAALVTGFAALAARETRGKTFAEIDRAA